MPPTGPSMNTTTTTFEPGSTHRFAGLRLAQRHLDTVVQASCDRFAVLSYRVGGVTRAIAVDHASGTRGMFTDPARVTEAILNGKAESVLDDLCAGRIGLRTQVPLDPVSSTARP